MKEEMLAVLNEQGDPTGEAVSRTEAHRNGILHGAARIYIYRIKNGIPEVLLQRRSHEKDSFPNCLDVSSAGHMEVGMSFDQTAVKELEEELGLKPEVADMTPAFRRRFSNITQQNGQTFNDQEVVQTYILRMDDLDLSKLRLQETEVSEVLWMDLDTISSRLGSADPELCLDSGEFMDVAQFF
jgi:isopentenyldiphosphate isomerase